VVEQFKKGNLRLLIATDVAARGLDVKDVQVTFSLSAIAMEEMRGRKMREGEGMEGSCRGREKGENKSTAPTKLVALDDSILDGF
jgi:superfamily II DNA or RNA helicase